MGIEIKSRALLKLNLKLFLDYIFLREGAFLTVSNSGQQFYDGSDVSLLLPDTSVSSNDYGLSPGQIWQSPFRQWVYESGVVMDGTNVPAPPINPSGIIVEGAFRPTDDPVYGHIIDYLNGRIIFNNPQPLELTVQGVYSARDVRIAFESQFNQQLNLGYLESKYTTNPLTSNQLVYPSGNAQPFPAIFIEVADRDFDAYELGNRSQIIKDTVNLYVWALDDITRDNIVDILTSQVNKRLYIIDWNKVPLPLSGIYNTISNEYIPYQKLVHNETFVTTVGSGTPVRYIAYIDKAPAKNQIAAKEYERSVVTYQVTTYLNAPITPFGDAFGPISSLPTIQDPGFPT